MSLTGRLRPRYRCLACAAMDPAQSGLSWLQVMGSPVAPALIIGIIYAFVWYREQAKQKRRERPPQEEKILRPAGYFALCRVEELNEKLMLALRRRSERARYLAG